jgi:hypothetical protein
MMIFDTDFIRFVIAYNAGRPIKKVAFYDRAANKKGLHNYMRTIFAETAQKFAQVQGWEIISPVGSDSTCFIEVGGPEYKKRPMLEIMLQQPEVDTIVVVAIDKLTTKDPKLYRELVGRVGAAGKNLIIVQDEVAVALDDKIGFVGSQHLYLMGELSEHGLLRSRN